MFANFSLRLFGFKSNSFKKKPLKNFSQNPITKKTKSDLELARIWNQLANDYFPDRSDLKNYSINWSTRPQKRTLASCNIKNLKVTVARELNYPKYQQWLSPLIYHEMCHSILGFKIVAPAPKNFFSLKKNLLSRPRRSWHNKEFRTLEKKHPMMREFDTWVKSGGWLTAVRSDRAIRSAKIRNIKI